MWQVFIYRSVHETGFVTVGFPTRTRARVFARAMANVEQFPSGDRYVAPDTGHVYIVRQEAGHV